MAVSIIISDAIPTLQNAAKTRVGISLWEHRITHNETIDHPQLFAPFPIDNLPLSDTPKNSLDIHVKFMADQIRKWIAFHLNKIFYNDKSYPYIIPKLKHLIWLSNGTIDYLATGRKLLEDATLLEIERTDIAMVYFFKDFLDNASYCELTPEEMKYIFTSDAPNDILKNMVEIALPEDRTSLLRALPVCRYYLLRIHERIAEFFRCYFADFTTTMEFINRKLLEYGGTGKETLVRTVLLGSGDIPPEFLYSREYV